jgi:hypothetical protein
VLRVANRGAGAGARRHGGGGGHHEAEASGRRRGRSRPPKTLSVLGLPGDINSKHGDALQLFLVQKVSKFRLAVPAMPQRSRAEALLRASKFGWCGELCLLRFIFVSYAILSPPW